MADSILCPCCHHERTLQARLAGTEAIYDDPALMLWRRPSGGIRGQVCTEWDGGWWECQACGLRLPPHKAGILLDAALMHSDPSCDSITEGVHADTRRAWSGGNATAGKGQP
jgi:hypothetical protein